MRACPARSSGAPWADGTILWSSSRTTDAARVIRAAQLDGAEEPSLSLRLSRAKPSYALLRGTGAARPGSTRLLPPADCDATAVRCRARRVPDRLAGAPGRSPFARRASTQLVGESTFRGVSWSLACVPGALCASRALAPRVSPRVAALRRTSLEIVDGDRPISRPSRRGVARRAGDLQSLVTSITFRRVNRAPGRRWRTRCSRTSRSRSARRRRTSRTPDSRTVDGPDRGRASTRVG